MKSEHDSPAAEPVSCLLHSAAPVRPGADFLHDVLCAARTHLGMDVSFIGRFENGRRIFTHVSSAGPAPIAPGDSGPLEESFCQRVVDGRLPELITDASRHPAAAELPVTRTLPVGAHVSVPLRLDDGSVYGTFCCFSYQPDETLTERDLRFVKAFADVVAKHISAISHAERERAKVERRVRELLALGNFFSVYQPIVDVLTLSVCAYEALTRFSMLPSRPANVWFEEATAVGLAAELERRTIAGALSGLALLPAGVYLSINVSPSTLLRPDLIGLFPESTPWHRVVIELTEHETIDCYERLKTALLPLRRKGARLAVDDAGAGYASFRHILALAPDTIKLDMSLVQNIDKDPPRAALAAALVSFADAMRMDIVAEGVENRSELDVLKRLGVRKAQGYFFGRPERLARRPG